jgi:PST family polysaccharide transporter
MATGAIWMVLFKFVEKGLGLASMLVLARLLTPDDFGIVAMAGTFIGMAAMFTAVGLDLAIIQSSEATADHYSTGWTLNVLIGAFIFALMLVCAQPIARFFGHDELVWIVGVLALGPLISGLENTGVVAFRRELNFRREFIYQISAKFAAFTIVVPLAFLWRSHWVLVTGALLSRAISVALSYLMHPFRPRFTLVKFHEMFHFSRWVLLNNVVAFFKERSTDFFVGRQLGPSALGVYNLSYELANLPTTEISAPINRALLPGFARLDSVVNVASAYANAIGILALVALPAAAGVYAVADYLVPVVLGAKWLQATPLLQVLAFNGAVLLFHSSICAVLIGRGLPSIVAATNGAYVVIMVGLLSLMTARYGVLGATYAVLATSVLATPVYLYQMQRWLRIGPMVFVRAVARPLIASVLMIIAVRWLLPDVDPTGPVGVMAGWLAAAVVFGAAVYAASVLGLWLAAGRDHGPEWMVVERAREMLLARLGLGRNPA